VAKGALLVLAPNDEVSLPIVKSIARNASNTSNSSFILPLQVSDHKLSIYELESDGKLNAGVNYPAINALKVPKVISGEGGKKIADALLTCSLSSRPRNVLSVTCTCDNSHDVMGYLAILISHKNITDKLIANESKCNLSASFSVIQDENSHVFALPIMGNSGITQSSTIYIGTFPGNAAIGRYFLFYNFGRNNLLYIN